MRVVHLSTTDCGGAFKAAYRISESMRNAGIDSSVIVRSRIMKSRNVVEVINTPYKKIISKFKNLINLTISKGDVISDYFGSDITKLKVVREADVVFLHWVNSFVSYNGVESLLNTDKKIIWVMHDMWLFTGGCHCDRYCGNYKKECGNCPMISGHRANDCSHRNFIRKKRMLAGKEILLVSPSKWIAECAGESDITKEHPILVLPNPIDYEVFYPLGQEKRKRIRKRYNIDANKKIILFGAVNSTVDENKGISSLEKILSALDKNLFTLVVFGNDTKTPFAYEGFDIINLGYVDEEMKMQEIYNMADIFLAPSFQESYGYTVAESLACGTPVAAYAVGGIKDQIQHGKNGYLAKINDADDLAEGIVYIADHMGRVSNTLKNDYNTIGEKYKQLCLES